MRSRLAALICILCSSAVSAESQTPRQLRITAATANVRQGPGTNEQIIGTLSTGTILEVVRDVGPWFQVRLSRELGFAVATGYVHGSTAELVRVVQRPQPPPPPPAVVPPAAPATTTRVAEPVRQHPGQRPKDPTMGLLISVVIPGGGHLYAGETKKGGILLGSAFGGIVLGTGLALGAAEHGSAGGASAGLLLGWGLYLGSWIYGIVDSQDAVRRHNASLGVTASRASPIIQPFADGRLGIGIAIGSASYAR